VVEFLRDLPKTKQPPARSKYDWEAIARALKREPGEWAVVARDVPRSHAAQIRAGAKRAFRPAEHYLCTTVGPAGPRADLYMAYIGSPGARLVAEKRHPRKRDEDE